MPTTPGTRPRPSAEHNPNRRRADDEEEEAACSDAGQAGALPPVEPAARRNKKRPAGAADADPPDPEAPDAKKPKRWDELTSSEQREQKRLLQAAVDASMRHKDGGRLRTRPGPH